MKQTPPDSVGTEDEYARALRDQLKEAVLGLIEHMGSEAFYVELTADDREPSYLVFGSGAHIQQFARALAQGETPDGGASEPGRMH